MTWPLENSSIGSRAKGITKENTLFIVTADENDHFVGGPPSPAQCNGITVPCTYAQIGEINTILNRLLITQRLNSTPFDIHFDDAPTFYIHGNPAATDPLTRTMEQDLDALRVVNPITGNTDRLSAFLADRAEMKLLHMVTSSAARTPSLTMFGNPDYFNTTNGSTADCSQAPSCVFESPGFAWNHGDVQQDITRSWMGMAGPGVRQLGRNDEVFSDHTDLRPTLLGLVGLKDTYVHDGRVLAEILHEDALPRALRQSREKFVELAQLYKQLNAPLGSVGMNSLVLANRSIVGDNTTYANFLATIGNINSERDALAKQTISLLDGAAFANQPIDDRQEDRLVRRGRAFIDKVEDLLEGRAH